MVEVAVERRLVGGQWHDDLLRVGPAGPAIWHADERTPVQDLLLLARDADRQQRHIVGDEAGSLPFRRVHTQQLL